LVFKIDTVQEPAKLRSDVWDFVNYYDESQEREALQQKLSESSLTQEFLLEEVKHMAKPCVFLTRNSKDGPFAGIWRGPGLVPAPKGNPEERPEDLDDEEDDREKYLHWITLNCDTLPEEFAPLQLRGTISIYSDEWSGFTTNYDKNQNGFIAHDPKLRFPLKPPSGKKMEGKGVPLYAKPGLSYPSRFQLLQYPTPQLRDWLTRMKHPFDSENFDISVPAKELRHVYEKFIYEFNPIFRQDQEISSRKRKQRDIVAVVGGWTIDTEFTYATLLGDTCYQFVYTREDSEPWIQAFIDKKSQQRFIRNLIT
jgi:hypothetical protein